MKDRILIAEPNEGTRANIASILESADYECLKAGNRLEIQALVQAGERLDLLITGITLHSEEGEAVFVETKNRFPDMPVIVLSEINDIPTARKAIRKGAYDYLLKPFDSADLLNTISRALENGRLKVENRSYQVNLESLVTARTEQLRQAITALERSYDITLNAPGDALDLKEGETEGHSKRVTAFTIAIARAMGVSVDQIRVIARGAFLHDVGKMAISDAILRKPGPLTDQETAMMREHCLRGYQILKQIPFLAEAVQIVYCHHENYDGTGYPRGLKGEQIPLGARITAVANTLDSMTSDLPYRAKLPFEVARDEIQRWSGRQFDPQVVATFLQMPENIWDDLRKGIDEQIHRFVRDSQARSGGNCIQ
jgi:cyclic di-GMP phosphodiesterase